MNTRRHGCPDSDEEPLLHHEGISRKRGGSNGSGSPTIAMNSEDPSCSQPEQHGKEAEEHSPLAFAGQFSATVLMGLVLLYMLAYSHSNSKFDYFEEEPQQQQIPDWAKSRLDSPGWVEQHDRFIAEINAAREEEGMQLLLYGDATFEMLRGSLDGEPNERAEEGPAIFSSYFSSWNAASVFGMAGDSTRNLMWRLENGEAPVALSSQACLVLSGAADLTYASFKGEEHILPAANGTARRLQHIADYLLSTAPESHIVLVGLLPRGDHTLDPQEAMRLPSRYSEGTEFVNTALEQFASEQRQISYLDCSEPFLTANGTLIRRDA
ncbi:hypothetical protein WJX84_006540, partial [Apatococcus fuscideae]